MPEYSLNKLVRNKYPAVYADDNQQAKITKLSGDDLKKELINKLTEEINELKTSNVRDEIISELADIKQIITDYERLSEISLTEVEEKRIKKELKLGGFSDGVFVETLKLDDNDKWNDYYQSRPDIFTEIK